MANPNYIQAISGEENIQFFGAGITEQPNETANLEETRSIDTSINAINEDKLVWFCLFLL